MIGSWEWKDATDTMENQFHQAGFDLEHPRIAKFLDLSCAFRICRGIWASIRAAW